MGVVVGESRNLNIIAIGASTGGPDAIYKVVGEIEPVENTVILIAQHMPANFTKRLADRLNERCRFNVVEASNGDMLKSGYVYVAKGGYHMEISKGRIVLTEEPPIHGVRPAVDKLFFSVAKEAKNKVLAVILTGMGKDGATGIKCIKDAGGITIAQDQESSAIYGMPKAAIETGAIDHVLPLGKIAEMVSRIMKNR